jgi:hypothetical protein
MMEHRRWKLWPNRISNELNGVSGLAGVGGTAIGVAGWAVLAGTAGTILMGGGAILAGGAFVYAIYKAVPPVLKHAPDLVGQTIELSELANIDPPLVKLAIVGATQSGKTTLKNRLSFKPKPTLRTQSPSAQIVLFPSAPPTYVAILDAVGEYYGQQFLIAEPADCLFIVLDHNISDTALDIDDDRLKTHSEFLRQLRNHLTQTKSSRKRWIEILVNKRDLWEKANAQEKVRFQRYWGEEVDKWNSANFADSVTSCPHSNEIGDDVARFMSRCNERNTRKP